MKKIRKVITILIVILFILQVLLYLFSHHEEDNYLDVDRVWISSIAHEPNSIIIEYTEADDIREILEKIQRFHFYRVPDSAPYNETPTDVIIISYKDGMEKEIVFSGGNVRICTGIIGTDSRVVKAYTYRYNEWIKFFNSLPKERELARDNG